jgi:hypothetical protein
MVSLCPSAGFTLGRSGEMSTFWADKEEVLASPPMDDREVID